MSFCTRMDAPRGGAPGKRKEREYSSSSGQRQALLPPPPPPPPTGKPEHRSKPHQLSRFANKPLMPTPPPQGGNSKLLAGYLAHEFLQFGTLLGERPGAPNRKESATPRPAPAPAPALAPDPAKRYAEASMLLMAGGARIPGVFNPTQLGSWLRIKE